MATVVRPITDTTNGGVDPYLAVGPKPAPQSLARNGGRCDNPAVSGSRGVGPELDAFADDLRRTLGSRVIELSADAIGTRARTTLPRAHAPVAVVRAETRSEVVQIVLAAGRHGVQLYSISRGQNWGYGDACAPTEGQVLLDLSGMNRIVTLDVDLAYAVVEPGVTFAQLAEAIDARGARLLPPGTGGSSSASVLGNAIERGFGRSPVGDRFLHSAGMDVILADGSSVQTTFGHYEGVSAPHAHKWGIGPSIDGLFSQSNLGIVVSMGIWLRPTPARTVSWLLRVSEAERLPGVIDALRRLHLSEALTSPTGGFGTLRLMSLRGSYPWDQSPGGGALSPEAIAAIKQRDRLPAWTVTGGLHGSRLQVAAGLNALRKATRGLGSLRVITPGAVKALHVGARVATRVGSAHAAEIGRTAREAGTLLGMLRGRMSDLDLMSCRWRLREVPHPESLDPLDNNCGFFWCAPTAPARGTDVQALISLVEQRVHTYDLDPMVGWTMLNGRTVLVPTIVYFDRDDDEACARAEECHEHLVRDCIAAGFPPYRAGVADMGLLDPNGDSFWQLVARLKDALDPGATLAPGRYAPWQVAREVGEPR